MIPWCSGRFGVLFWTRDDGRLLREVSTILENVCFNHFTNAVGGSSCFGIVFFKNPEHFLANAYSGVFRGGGRAVPEIMPGGGFGGR